jgi:ribose transport system substrate-binding protein
MKTLKYLAVIAVALSLLIGLSACNGEAEKEASSKQGEATESSESGGESKGESAEAKDIAMGAEDPKTGLSMYTEMGKYKKEPPYTIGYSFHGGGISFDIQSINAFNWVMENRWGHLVDEYYVKQAQFDVNKQISDIEDLMAKDIDALLVSPTSPSAVIPKIDELYEQGIPVVIVLGEYDGKKYTAYRASDDRAFGRIGAQWLVEQLKESNGAPEGDIIVLRGVAGAAADVARWNRGAKPVFDKYSDINVVGKAEGKWAYDEGRRVASSLLSAHPDIDGIWSCGGQMSLAAGEIMLERDMDLVPITGEDYNGFLKFWMEHRDKGFSSIAPTYPSWFATRGLDVLLNVLQGESVKRTIEYPPPTITDETVENFVIEGLPKSIWVASSLPHDVMRDMYEKE